MTMNGYDLGAQRVKAPSLGRTIKSIVRVGIACAVIYLGAVSLALLFMVLFGV